MLGKSQDSSRKLSLPKSPEHQRLVVMAILCVLETSGTKRLPRNPTENKHRRAASTMAEDRLGFLTKKNSHAFNATRFPLNSTRSWLVRPRRYIDDWRAHWSTHTVLKRNRWKPNPLLYICKSDHPLSSAYRRWFTRSLNRSVCKALERISSLKANDVVVAVWAIDEWQDFMHSKLQRYHLLTTEHRRI